MKGYWALSFLGRLMEDGLHSQDPEFLVRECVAFGFWLYWGYSEMMKWKLLFRV